MNKIHVFITNAKVVDEDIIRSIQYTGYAGKESNIMLVPLLKGNELMQMESGSELEYCVCSLIMHPLFNREAAIVLDYKMKHEMKDISGVIEKYLDDVSPDGIMESEALENAM